MGLSTFDAFKRLQAADAIPLEGERLRDLQKCLLTILDDIVAVCTEENIVWTLGGGSVLGAIRHRGFIPWDDDLDLNMPRGEWPRFRAAFLARFGEKYAIYEPGSPADYPLSFPRIRLRGSRVVTREDLLLPDIEPGAFIDVFMLENTFDNALLRVFHGFGSMLLGFCYSCRKQFAERKLLRRWGVNGAAFRVKRTLGCLLAFASLGGWTRLWDRWNRLCGNDASRLVTFPVGRRHFFGELAPRTELGESAAGEFEGRTVNIPKGAAAYMTRLYGPDYMTLPPEADRERHSVFEPLRLARETDLSQRTAAVVVTFNRPSCLRTCLTALHRQSVPCGLVLVDNGTGADAIARDCGIADFTYLPMETNVGGAGGFSIGIQKAVSLGYDRIWILDDDAEPTSRALERLQGVDRRMDGAFGWLSSKCVTDEGHLVPINVQRRTPFAKLRFARRSLIRAEMASFVSLYVPAAVIREVGLPIAEFFIWCDDLEYTRRISMRRPCYAVGDSCVRHDGGLSHVSNLAVDFEERIPRYYYAFRNEFFTYRREGFRGLLYFMTKVVWNELKMLLRPDRLFFARHAVLWRGVFAGFLFHPEVRPCR